MPLQGCLNGSPEILARISSGACRSRVFSNHSNAYLGRALHLVIEHGCEVAELLGQSELLLIHQCRPSYDLIHYAIQDAFS